jgi:hypothetical protein
MRVLMGIMSKENDQIKHFNANSLIITPGLRSFVKNLG